MQNAHVFGQLLNLVVQISCYCSDFQLVHLKFGHLHLSISFEIETYL